MHWHGQANHRCQVATAESGGNNDSRGGERCIAGVHDEPLRCRIDMPDRRVGPVVDALVQRAQQMQRAGVAVQRTETGAGDVVAECRHHGPHLVAREHPCADVAAFVVHAADERCAVLIFLVGQTEGQAAGLLQRGLGAQPFSQWRPQRRRQAGPVGVGRHAGAFALHPDQAEVSPARRGTRCRLRPAAPPRRRALGRPRRSRRRPGHRR